MNLAHTAGLAGSLTLLVQGPPTPQPHVEYLWGGETRQIFTLDDAATSSRHVWTVGDGPMIRHAINPTASTAWELQTVPSDVTQNLLDVSFIAGNGGPSSPAHIGFACGVNGNVLKTVDYGATWVHLDSGAVTNQTSAAENATLWRSRFLSENDGFAAGLWTFKRWNGAAGTWSGVTLKDSTLAVDYAGKVEFYSLELIVDPSDPTKWVGVAAGQLWSAVGGGHPDTGIVFSGRWDFNSGNTWVETFRTTLPSGGLGGGVMNIDDPWDLAFAPNPASITQATGYLSAGGNLSEFPTTGSPTGNGGVWRTTDSGRHWTLELPGAAGETVTTLYGCTALDAGHAVAVGYGGQVWYRDGTAGWTCRRGIGTPCLTSNPTSDNRSGPLSGCHAAYPDVYVSGSWGYIETSSLPTPFATAGVKLNPASSDTQGEHWRFEDILIPNSGPGFAVGQHKAIAETSDSGANWSPSPSSPGAIPPTHSVGGLFALASGGGIVVTVGSGDFTSESLLAQQFAYRYDTTAASPAWTAGAPSGSLQLNSLTLQDVAYAQGTGSSAEFWAAGFALDSNNAVQPALYRSVNGGTTWSDANGAGVVPSGVKLTGVVFRGGTEGFAVGFSPTGPVAYRIDLTGGPSITLVSVASFGGTQLLGVAANDYAVVAVGKNAGVLVYSPSSGFGNVGGVPSLGFAVTPDYVSVAMPPGNDARVLISAAQSAEELDSPGLGKLLYFHNGWKVLREGSNKDIHGIYLRSDGGWAVAGHGNNISSEVGMVGDIMVLRFDPALQVQ